MFFDRPVTPGGGGAPRKRSFKTRTKRLFDKYKVEIFIIGVILLVIILIAIMPIVDPEGFQRAIDFFKSL